MGLRLLGLIPDLPKSSNWTKYTTKSLAGKAVTTRHFSQEYLTLFKVVRTSPCQHRADYHLGDILDEDAVSARDKRARVHNIKGSNTGKTR